VGGGKRAKLREGKTGGAAALNNGDLGGDRQWKEPPVKVSWYSPWSGGRRHGAKGCHAIFMETEGKDAGGD